MEKNENGVAGDQHDMSKLSEMDAFDPSWSNEGIHELEFEPDRLRKGKELLQLLAVNIPAEKAFTLFNGKQAYIIKTGHQDGGLCRAFMINDEQFIQRTNILRDSRKALERLTSCEIFIKIEIVVVIGKSQGIKMVRAMVKDCIVSNESPAPKIRSVERGLAGKDIEAVPHQLHEKQH
ncbi:hypothetical protein M0R45_015171 [Rubus argutus]|uniref:KRR1 small subunit processome component second KH domain-containing protein n=1 Tax=Rubus argutus TaxID=59490 RepID=A0AAW1XS59_RUBAR